MTRARERLLLSGAVEFERWPEQRRGATTISWLGPALAPEVPALASRVLPPVHDLAVGVTHVRLRLSSPASAGDVLHRGSMSVGAPVVPSYLGGAANLEPAIPRIGQMRLLPVRSPGAGGTGPAGRTGGAGLTSTLSYTSLAELERCGYRYYLERELGMSEDRSAARFPSAGGTLEARARGTLVHGLLERLDFPRSPRTIAGGGGGPRSRAGHAHER